jgi:hypothetical protein
MMYAYKPDRSYAIELAERKKYNNEKGGWYWLEDKEKEEIKKKIGEITEEEIQEQMKGNVGYKMTNADKKFMEISKTKILHTCNLCKTEIGSGMKLLGKGYGRFCPKCALEFLPKVIADLKEYIDLAETSLKEMSEIDYQKWEEENKNKIILTKLKERTN